MIRLPPLIAAPPLGLRVGLVAVTGALVLLFSWEFVDVGRTFAGRDQLLQDWRFYASLGQRWLDTGVMYGERQLSGEPYHVLVNVDNLYPPPAIAWFVPFALLPELLSGVLWWGIPIAVIGFAVYRFRPALWTWPLLALCLAWPRTSGALVVGNSDLWSAGFVAGGLLWGWPGALGIFKPSFGPFALVGARRRSWWVAAAAIGLVSLLLLRYWPEYLVAATHWDLPWDRAIPSAPLLLLPIVAWLGRTSRAETLPPQGNPGPGAILRP